MNIVYHATVAAAADVALEGRGILFLVGLLPDLTLLFNEARLRYERRPFDPEAVDVYSYRAYHLAHSLWVTAAMFGALDWRFGIAHLLHIVPDWVTHTGRFAAMPLYPLSKQRLEGWEILK